MLTCLQAHHLAVESDACHAVVVILRGDYSGNMGSVAVVIHRVVVVSDEVPAVVVIYVAVTVVINSVAGDFACVYPYIVSYIYMIIVHARVYDCDYDIARAADSIAVFLLIFPCVINAHGLI